jgi:hypothetical protein
MYKYLIIVIMLSCATNKNATYVNSKEFNYEKLIANKVYLVPLINTTNDETWNNYIYLSTEKILKTKYDLNTVFGMKLCNEIVKIKNSENIFINIEKEYIINNLINEDYLSQLYNVLGEGYVILYIIDDYYYQNNSTNNSYPVYDKYGRYKRTQFNLKTDDSALIHGELFIYDLKNKNKVFYANDTVIKTNKRYDVESQGCIEGIFGALFIEGIINDKLTLMSLGSMSDYLFYELIYGLKGADRYIKKKSENINDTSE